LRRTARKTRFVELTPYTISNGLGSRPGSD
jgi:hypothetical protein